MRIRIARRIGALRCGRATGGGGFVMGGDSAEDAAPADDGERGGSSIADEASSARPTPESTSAGGGVADAAQQHGSSGANLGNVDVDVARGGAAGASGGETRSENPAPPQPITIPGRSGHHRGRHRRGKSRGGSGSGSGWGSYGGGSGDGFGRFGWGSATIDEWVMSGWPPSQSNTPRTGSFSAPGYDPFAASPRAGSFSAGSAPGPAGASPRGFAWWPYHEQQQPTSPVHDRAGRLSRGSIVFDPDDCVPSPRQSRANPRGFPGASASSATLTVYVREIPSGASEGDVHDHFYTCGSVRECRVSADPHSQSTPDGGGKKRVAFVAFETENAVREALTMDGSLLLGEPIRVMPSRTEVMPVDPGLLPRTDEERERCARTVYVSNVDPDVRSQDLRSALERVADGKIAALHLQARKNNKGKGPRRAHTNAADEERQKKATSVAFAEFCDVDAALRAIDATGQLIVGSLPVFVAASKTPLKPPKKSRRSHFASAEVSSTMSAATAASTGVTSTTNESGDTGDTQMIHEDDDDIHEDDIHEDEDAAYAYEDGSLDDAIREGGTRDVPDDDGADSDETYEDDAPSASPPNGSETTTTTDSPVSVAPPETNDETEATTTKMGKLTVGGVDAEVIPLVDETEFPPLGR